MGTLASRPGIKTLLLISAAAWIIPSVNAQLSVSLTPSTPSPSVVGTVVTWTAAVSNLRAATYRYRFVTRGFDRLARVAKDFGPESGHVVTRIEDGHHLDGAAREAELHRPERGLPRPVEKFVDFRREDVAR